MIFFFWSCEELEICAKMKIINFVTHSTSSSLLFDLPDQSEAARVHSYNFLCSILPYTATNNIFLSKDNANFVNFYQKARKTNRALRLYANYTVFDITCKQEPTLLLCTLHLADLSSVRYKTSTWNEIKELIKSNYLIVPSLLNKSSKNMTWNDRWETKLFFRRTWHCTLERMECRLY